MDKLEICNIIKKHFNCWCTEGGTFCSAVMNLYYQLEKEKEAKTK